MAEKEYIEREKAIEKCNKLLDNAATCPHPEMLDGIRLVRDLILTDCETGLPAADVVEVVRCENCEFIHDPQYGTGYCYPEGSASYRVVSLDDFCKYGKRRDKENGNNG